MEVNGNLQVDGNVTAAGTPVNPNDLANKAYADTKLALAGGTMTGPLILSADPTGSLEAATKNYVDTHSSGGGGSSVSSYVVVGSIAARDAIPSGSRTEGMRVEVVVNNVYTGGPGAHKYSVVFQLLGDLVTWVPLQITSSDLTTATDKNIALGANALAVYATASTTAQPGGGNIAIGQNSQATAEVSFGYNTQNVTIGENTLRYSAASNDSVAIGFNAASSASISAASGFVAIGSQTLGSSTINPSYGIAIGYQAALNGLSYNSIAIGPVAGFGLDGSGHDQIAIGSGAFSSHTGGGTGSYNIAIGNNTLTNGGGGGYNINIGDTGLSALTSGGYNIGIGSGTLIRTTTGYSNVGIGYGAGSFISPTNGSCTAVGANSLSAGTGALYADNCSGFGANSCNFTLTTGTITNSTGLGANSRVTGSNQVQIGDSATTTYVYGTVQNRSDARDKTEIRDTVLGLDFISKLRVVDFKWNFREDYIVTETVLEPREVEIKTINEDGSEEIKIGTEMVPVRKTTTLPNDGSKARSRFHHGLIAQEVADVIKSTGVDFGGYQDHSIAGGDDVKTIGYDELIAPLIKSVQELSKMVVDLQSEVNKLKNP